MRHVRPPLIGCASLPKRALSASATWPAGTVGIDAVVVAEFEGACAGGGDGTGRLLGPKITPVPATGGEIFWPTNLPGPTPPPAQTPSNSATTGSAIPTVPSVQSARARDP